MALTGIVWGVGLHSLQVRCLCEHGYRDLFGHCGDENWQVYQDGFGVERPEGDSFPLAFFGDEVEVFDKQQYMCINFSSESNPLYKNSFVSRFLIFMMPVSKYYIQGKKKEKTNLSLQEALKIITASLNKLGVEGSHGLRGVCASIRGDWKWLVQALQLKYGPSSNEICAVCKATRGLQVPLTDLSDSAGWRSQLRDGEVWFARPPLANLRNFSMRLVTFDIMHTFHLGFGRDLAASVLVFLLKKNCFPGPNVLAID